MLYRWHQTCTGPFHSLQKLETFVTAIPLLLQVGRDPLTTGTRKGVQTAPLRLEPELLVVGGNVNVSPSKAGTS